jgi:hypothetical protein
MDQLFSCLLDLLRELDTCRIPITIGGGFGLYLKRLHLERTVEPTLFSELPAIRSTNDIDMFLRVELLADLTRTREVADAIKRLGYTPVEEARFLQWSLRQRASALQRRLHEPRVCVGARRVVHDLSVVALPSNEAIVPDGEAKRLGCRRRNQGRQRSGA